MVLYTCKLGSPQCCVIVNQAKVGELLWPRQNLSMLFCEKKCLTYTYIFSSNYQVLKPPLKRNTFDISFHGQQNLENSYGMNIKFKCFLPILIYKFEIFISHMFAITYSYLMMIQYIKSDDDSCHLLVI